MFEKTKKELLEEIIYEYSRFSYDKRSEDIDIAEPGEGITKELRTKIERFGEIEEEIDEYYHIVFDSNLCAEFRSGY